MGAKVWYSSHLKLKIAAKWDVKASITKLATNSYKLGDEKGKKWIANQRYVKERF